MRPRGHEGLEQELYEQVSYGKFIRWNFLRKKMKNVEIIVPKIGFLLINLKWTMMIIEIIIIIS